MTTTNPPRVDGTGKRILVVDDDLAIRVLLQAVLRRMKFTVELAEDGQSGLEKLQKDSGFDLILLDLMMPRVNGYEFISRVEQAFLERKPHIIVFTAAGQRGVDRIPGHAICNAILKPFDLEKFLDLVKTCIDDVHAHDAMTAQQLPD